MINLTEEQAEHIFRILVKYAGASPKNATSFVRTQIDRKYSCTEYRVQGKLGFGGKFWNNAGRLYITCYQETETKSRRRIINKVNKLLNEYLIKIKEE